MPNPYEREQTEAFEEEVGGPSRGFELMRLYQRCVESVSGDRFRLGARPRTAADLLRKNGPTYGFSRRAVEMFLALQG
jgi:hypothetical protein